MSCIVIYLGSAAFQSVRDGSVLFFSIIDIPQYNAFMTLIRH